MKLPARESGRGFQERFPAADGIRICSSELFRSCSCKTICRLGRLLPEWFWHGFLPGVQNRPAELVPEFRAGYPWTCVERDVRMLADVQNWQQFSLFLRLAAALTAREINQHQPGREIGMTAQNAKRWLQVPRGTFQWLEIPDYRGNLISEFPASPKATWPAPA